MKRRLPKTDMKLIEKSIEDMPKFLAGEQSSYTVYHDPDSFVTPAEVKAARRSTKLSQSAFARALGVSLVTLKSWENGRRRPRGMESKVLRNVEDRTFFRKLAHT